MDKSDFLNFRALALEVRQLRSLAAEEALYLAKVEEKTAALLAIEAAIGSLDAPVERLLMRLRYIEGRGWTSVCDVLRPLGYSERQVYRLHGFALQKLKEV